MYIYTEENRRRVRNALYQALKIYRKRKAYDDASHCVKALRSTATIAKWRRQVEISKAYNAELRKANKALH